MIVVWFFLAVPWVCLELVILVYPDNNHLLFSGRETNWANQETGFSPVIKQTKIYCKTLDFGLFWSFVPSKAFCIQKVIYPSQLHCLFSFKLGKESSKMFFSVTSDINCIVARCLINVVYLPACAFIRS